MTIVILNGAQATKKRPEPTQNSGHRHKAKHKKPIVAPPRAPADLGVIVAVGPLSPGDDLDLPHNKTFPHWVLLPLTPASISIQAQGNWTDGLFPVNGPEHAMYAGMSLETISFSGRLEPPAYYTNATRVGKLAAVDTGHWLNHQRRNGGVVASENTQALQTVRGPGGQLLVVESSQISGPLDVNKGGIL